MKKLINVKHLKLGIYLYEGWSIWLYEYTNSFGEEEYQCVPSAGLQQC